jgi:hypothetical protein
MSNQRRIVPQLVEQYNDLIEQNLVQNYLLTNDSICGNNKTLLTDSQLIVNNEELVINEENVSQEEVDQNSRLIESEDNVIQTNDVLGSKLIIIKFFSIRNKFEYFICILDIV